MTTLIRSLWYWSTGFKGQVAIGFGTLVIGSLLAAGTYLIRMTSANLVDLGGAIVHATARSASQLLSSNMLYREQEIALLARSRLLIESDLRTDQNIREELELHHKLREGFAWLGVTDAEGKVVQDIGNLLAGVNVSTRPWFQAALNGTHVGDLHEAKLLAQKIKAPVEGEPVRFIDFASPIHGKDGRLRGVIGAHAHWQWVTATVESVMTDSLTARKTEILIAAKDGAILFPHHYEGKLRLPGQRDKDAKFEILEWTGEGSFLTTVLPFQSVSANQAGLGWQIIVRQPYDSVLRDARELRQRLLVIGAFIIGIMLLMVYLLARRISRPIEELSVAAGSIHDNAAAYAPTGGGREMHKIRRVFETMAGALRRHEEELRAINASLERKVAERTEQLKQLNAELERIAITDGLTGVCNRRHFDERLEQTFKLMLRTKRGFSLLLFDIDHFKKVNDSYGHQAGDEVLRHFAALLVATVRATDLVARYGGEEFVVILNDVGTESEAMVAASKVIEAVRSHDFPGPGRLTTSIGLTTTRPTDSAPADILRRADEALYLAKSGGRDRIVISGGTESEQDRNGS